MKIPYVYVVSHPALRSVKIGHGSEAVGREGRIEELGRHGWQLHRRLFVKSTQFAYAVEQATLFQIRHRMHAPQHLPAGGIPVGGWTETVSATLVNAEAVWGLLCTEAGLAWLASDQPRRRTAHRVHAEKPLKEADLQIARDLAQSLGGANQLSTRKIREAVGCRTEYAVRLRNAVQSEQS